MGVLWMLLTVLVWLPELLGQRHSCNPTVHLFHRRQLRRLEDRARDGMQRVWITIHRGHGHLEADLVRLQLGGDLLGAAERDHRVAQKGHVRAQAAQHGVELHEHLHRGSGMVSRAKLDGIR